MYSKKAADFDQESKQHSALTRLVWYLIGRVHACPRWLKYYMRSMNVQYVAP